MFIVLSVRVFQKGAFGWNPRQPLPEIYRLARRYESRAK
jgi:hypothetical protein